jgi:translation initiation factor 4A
VNVALKETQIVMLVPTHELANQIYRVVTSLSVFMEGLVVKTLLGGTPVHEDLEDLKNNTPHIIIGCTGRVYDMLRRRAMSLDYLQLCILDEADEMLSQGFKEQIYNIFQIMPANIQIALFSATMPEPMMKLTEKFMRDPVSIVMKTEELNLDGIRQYYIAIPDDRAKYDTLKSIFEQLTISQTIIYANSVNRVMDLYNAMLEEGFSVCCIHSNMNKIDRNVVITGFRSGAYRVLISSNLTARGIDVQQVNTVINFDIPRSTETYLHRIGRSGRWGRKGTAINFVTKHDIQYMKAIEKHYSIDIAELPKDFSW